MNEKVHERHRKETVLIPKGCRGLVKRDAFSFKLTPFY